MTTPPPVFYPIALVGVGGTQGAAPDHTYFAPQFTKEPRCNGEGCEWRTTYEWSLEQQGGNNLKLTPAAPVTVTQPEPTGGRAKITGGRGRFTLCIKVRVTCRCKVSDEPFVVYRLTDCQASACDEFEIA